MITFFPGRILCPRGSEGERERQQPVAEEARPAAQDPDGGGAAPEAGGRQRQGAPEDGAAQHGIQPGTKCTS